MGCPEPLRASRVIRSKPTFAYGHGVCTLVQFDALISSISPSNDAIRLTLGPGLVALGSPARISWAETRAVKGRRETSVLNLASTTSCAFFLSPPRRWETITVGVS